MKIIIHRDFLLNPVPDEDFETIRDIFKSMSVSYHYHNWDNGTKRFTIDEQKITLEEADMQVFLDLLESIGNTRKSEIHLIYSHGMCFDFVLRKPDSLYTRYQHQ